MRSQPHTDQAKKQRTRWKTISVRGLLLLILVIGLWLGFVANKAREQREAVAALQEFGGFVHYDWEFKDGPVKVPRGNSIWRPAWGKFAPMQKPWAPVWMRRTFGDDYFQSIAHVSLYVDIKKGVADSKWVNMGRADNALKKLATQTSVRTLQIGGNQVSDENLAFVGKLTGLEELSIMWGYPLTDKGIARLSGLKRLRILELDQSKLTDTGLEAIGKLTNLEELRLGGAGFSDRGLEHLKGLTRLKILTVWEGKHQITDAGLEHLKNMKQLEDLDLHGWQVSDLGIAKLRELPNLKSIRLDLPKDQQDRRDRLARMLPGVKIE
jgi:Leucine Rich repeat